MSNFNRWLKLYNANKMLEFSRDDQALLWLKIKSIVRKEWLRSFVTYADLQVESKTLNKQWQELFSILADHPKAHQLLDAFIRAENRNVALALPVEQLVSELYKMRNFDWGGNYQNNLDRYLVDNFIKTTPSFDSISQKINAEIAVSVAGYILCSWYNHWSSILIEHLFKEHDKVLPTLGMIKKVDFFVDQIPFDLKVTYLPMGYIAEQRRKRGLRSEIAELRTYAKTYGLRFDRDTSDETQAYEISQKLLDAKRPEASNLQNIRNEILIEARQHSQGLIKWLYENQGERRFDASNRLFIILVDTTDWDASWKLKRNLDLLRPAIHQWIDHFSKSKLESLHLGFKFDSKTYECFSDAIFVVKE
jgi:hypothetical protein